MSVDIVLVSNRPLTLDDLRSLFDDPAVSDELGPAAYDGDPAAFPRITTVDTGRLAVTFYGPQEARTTGAAPYTTDLGVVAPKDDEGRTWWTRVAVAEGADDEPGLEVLFGVLAALARAGSGFVVVDGEIAELEGVARPEPLLEGTDAAPPTAAAAARTFLELFLPIALPDRDGWAAMLGLVKRVCGDHTELLPRWIQQDGEWREFVPSAEPPAWWPMQQTLGGSDPAVEWELAPAAFPGDTLTQVSLSGDLDLGTTGDLLGALTGLEPAYGFLHYWTPAEPVGTAAVGLRQWYDVGPPGSAITHRDVAEHLPDLYWAQVIGPAWEAHIGRERIASTPAHRVEEVRPGQWLLQLTPDPSDLVLDYQGFATARARCREHLGEQHFWAPGRDTGPVVVLPPVV
jgi:hypothetical protein